jgi:hypothetical protein
MEHPLIHDLTQLTVDELTAKISELHRKLSVAHRSGNGHLCDQIRMALHSYTTMQQQRLEEQFKKYAGDDVGKFNDKIDVS